MPRRKIFIVAGEPSGDLHAAKLVRHLKTLDPELTFFGMGGKLMREAGVNIVVDIAGISVVGFVGLITNALAITRASYTIRDRVDLEKPDAAILVDYPGFNLKAAIALKKRGVPVIYYISPQVWAWGRDRIEIIKRCVEKMIVLFDFEEHLYREHGVDAEFVGNPLVETVKPSLSKKAAAAKYELSRGKTTIALLPGSRSAEVGYLLPVMAQAGQLIGEKGIDCQFLVAKHPSLPLELYRKALATASIDVKIVEADTYNVVHAADFAMVASGTATLETAIIGTPLVILYKTPWLTAIIARALMTSKYLGIVNILAGREIAPEFLQEQATPQAVAETVTELLKSDRKLAAMKDDLRRVVFDLGTPGAGERAAHVAYKALEKCRTIGGME